MMMKRLLLTLTLLLSIVLPQLAQKTFELTNPITLGILLVDDSDQQRMEEICRYFQLTESSPEDGYSVFLFSDGSTVRFKVEESTSGKTKTPIIEVTLADKKTRAAETLLLSGYRQTSSSKGRSTYERGSSSANRHTVCTQLSPFTYLFTKTSHQLIEVSALIPF